MEQASTHTPPDPSSADPAHPDPDLAEALGRGHEQRDASIRAVVVFCVVLAISVAGIQVAVLLLEKLLLHQNAAQDSVRTSSALTYTTPVGTNEQVLVHAPPPMPRLQPSLYHSRMDTEDMGDQERNWQSQLHGYGKVSDDPDRAHVPVEKMIDLATEKGFAALKPAAGKDATKDATKPGAK